MAIPYKTLVQKLVKLSVIGESVKGSILPSAYRLFKKSAKSVLRSTREIYKGHRVSLLPVSAIRRREQVYTFYKSDADHQTHKNKVNALRKAIRAGHKIPPILVLPLRKMRRHEIDLHLDGGDGIVVKHKKRYTHILINGHHRLTAHQAEGKPYIRVVISRNTWLPRQSGPKSKGFGPYKGASTIE